jgi:hypothetical protein
MQKPWVKKIDKQLVASKLAIAMKEWWQSPLSLQTISSLQSRLTLRRCLRIGHIIAVVRIGWDSNGGQWGRNFELSLSYTVFPQYIYLVIISLNPKSRINFLAQINHKFKVNCEKKFYQHILSWKTNTREEDF